jgi:transcriptional regulator with XRE-family HTH domain
MMAYYEGPIAQPPANLLPQIARALGVSIDALLGVESSRQRAKASDMRMQRRMAQIEKLSAPERRQILQALDALIKRGQLKQKMQTTA